MHVDNSGHESSGIRMKWREVEAISGSTFPCLCPQDSTSPQGRDTRADTRDLVGWEAVALSDCPMPPAP